MNLQAQIELITMPQEFTRLCNAVLRAEHGDDFLAIDDDRSDRGNDGYLKSENRMFAGHCFKRVQNRSLDQNIRQKMLADLRKAIQLKQEGVWDIKAWTFLCNYPITEDIAKSVILLGRESGIDVGWRGPDYLAGVLQKYKSARELFPNLSTNEIMEQLSTIIAKLEQLTPGAADKIPVTWAPRTAEEQLELILQQPIAWEPLLFAGVLIQEKNRLEFKWRDYEVGYAPRTGRHLDDRESMPYLVRTWSDVHAITNGIMVICNDDDTKIRSFGLPGEPGNAVLIEHFARRIIGGYEELLDWAANLRGLGVSKRIAPVFELAALVVGQPARDIRRFVDEVVYQTEKIPTLVSEPGDEPLNVEIGLFLTVDEDIAERLTTEISNLEQEVRDQLDGL